jgi:hypothetical protein
VSVSLQVFDAFVKVQQDTYPDYFEELKGISDGSGQPLTSVILINLDEELSYFLPNNTAFRGRVRPLICCV